MKRIIMNYTEVKIIVSQDDLERLVCALEDVGITGLAVEDPRDFQELLEKKRGYEWDYIDADLYKEKEAACSATFYVEDTLEGMALMDKALHEAESLDTTSVEIRAVCDDDWKDRWKEYFKPAKITDRIVIKPSWESYEPADPSELILEIDPGMAFGTGTHPTTTLCMRAIEKYLSSERSSLLDVGCGSGILSIGAGLLGAKEILGIEIDPIAVDVSKNNVERNGLSQLIEIREGDLTKGLDRKFSLVAANLMADLVIMLSGDVEKHLLPGGVYISSGILLEKRDLVAEAIKGYGFTIMEIPEEGEWCAIVAQKA